MATNTKIRTPQKQWKSEGYSNYPQWYAQSPNSPAVRKKQQQGNLTQPLNAGFSSLIQTNPQQQTQQPQTQMIQGDPQIDEVLVTEFLHRCENAPGVTLAISGRMCGAVYNILRLDGH